MSEYSPTSMSSEINADYLSLLLENAQRGVLTIEDIPTTSRHLGEIAGSANLAISWGVTPDVNTAAAKVEDIRFALGSGDAVHLQLPVDGQDEPLRFGPDSRIPGLQVFNVQN